MRFAVVTLIAVILASCSPQKRLARLLDRFPLQQDTLIQYQYNTVIRDTTITVEIPGDIIYRDTLIPFIVDLPYMELQTRSTLAEARAWVWANELGLELVQFDTLFSIKLDSALRHDIDTIFMEVVREVPTLVKEKSFWMHGFLTLAGLILIGMILWFLLKK